MNTSSQLSHKPYSIAEEWANSLTHGVGFAAAIVGLVFLLYRAESSLGVVTTSIYGASLLLMFLSSTLYHAIQPIRLKALLKTIDHSAIYLLIAGTYTPFLLMSMGGWLGWTSSAVIWSLAMAGVLFKIIARGRYPKISLIAYLSFGWLAVVIIYPLYLALPAGGLWLLLLGGLCFSIGAIFYALKQIKYTHSIWHVFVLAGCTLHYFSIYYFVL